LSFTVENWHHLTEITHPSATAIRAVAELPMDSPWFSGHFPGEPILPGVAQIALVVEAIRRGKGRDVKITGVKRTRFKQIIAPGDSLAIEVDLKDDAAASAAFRILIRGDVACSGSITTAAGKAPE
jgi:3-hydroxymyristoyl/3-hydroxydecanoyl-(acyl carrier protein) dehydratase